jgi:hypothetical protein
VASYWSFPNTRTTTPDPIALLSAVRIAVADPEAGVSFAGDSYTVKKETAWTEPNIIAAREAILNAPASTPQTQAQQEIDRFSIKDKAVILTILDQFNLIRSKLIPPLAEVTPQQMISAIRTKAGNLSQ